MMRYCVGAGMMSVSIQEVRNDETENPSRLNTTMLESALHFASPVSHFANYHCNSLFKPGQ